MTQRIILFRGKRIDNGEFAQGDLIHGVKHKLGKFYILPDNINQPGCHHLDGFEVDPATVGQFIGLTGKNEKQIFDGDVVKFIDANSKPIPFSEFTTEIVWWNEFSRFTLRNTHTVLSFLESVDMEVIGNIFDNPELLTK